VNSKDSAAKFVVVVVQFLCNMVYVKACFIEIVYTSCYVGINRKGIESTAVKTGQDIKWKIKWLSLSMKFLSAVR
jgi:hypothetical protein